MEYMRQITTDQGCATYDEAKRKASDMEDGYKPNSGIEYERGKSSDDSKYG